MFPPLHPSKALARKHPNPGKPEGSQSPSRETASERAAEPVLYAIGLIGPPLPPETPGTPDGAGRFRSPAPTGDHAGHSNNPTHERARHRARRRVCRFPVPSDRCVSSREAALVVIPVARSASRATTPNGNDFAFVLEPDGTGLFYDLTDTGGESVKADAVLTVQGHCVLLTTSRSASAHLVLYDEIGVDAPFRVAEVTKARRYSSPGLRLVGTVIGAAAAGPQRTRGTGSREIACSATSDPSGP